MIQHKPSFFMFVGVPYSGKSTAVNKFLRTDPDGFVVLDTDSTLIKMAKEEGITYQESFSKNYKASHKIMYERLNQAIKDHSDIIWDQTNMSVKARAKKLIMIPDFYVKIAMVFNPDINAEYYLKQVESRPDKHVPRHAVEELHKTFEMPTHSEGFDTIYEFDYSKNEFK